MPEAIEALQAELRAINEQAQNPPPQTHKRKRYRKGEARLPRGNQTTFDDNLAHEITSRLANGETLSNICHDPHMPPIGTVLGWQGSRPSFDQDVARARRSAIEAWSHQVVDIADKAPTTKGGVHKARLQTDVRFKLMGKLAPERYGDRVVAVLEGGDRPIQTTDGGALELARWLAFKLTGGAEVLAAISDGPKLLEPQASGRSDVGSDGG